VYTNHITTVHRGKQAPKDDVMFVVEKQTHAEEDKLMMIKPVVFSVHGGISGLPQVKLLHN
jgi:hypothetical protein